MRITARENKDREQRERATKPNEPTKLGEKKNREKETELMSKDPGPTKPNDRQNVRGRKPANKGEHAEPKT